MGDGNFSGNFRAEFEGMIDRIMANRNLLLQIAAGQADAVLAKRIVQVADMAVETAITSAQENGLSLHHLLMYASDSELEEFMLHYSIVRV